MKEIKLTQGKVALVDDEDFDRLSPYKWHLKKRENYFYAATSRGRIVMHRFIMQVNDPSIFIDHVNHNGLDNRRDNLRVCSNQENQWNRGSNKGTSSKYVGVSKVIMKKKGHIYTYWVAYIKENNKPKHLGYFPFTPEGEIRAATRRDDAAKNLYGAFAHLNFPQ